MALSTARAYWLSGQHLARSLGSGLELERSEQTLVRSFTFSICLSLVIILATNLKVYIREV